MSEGLAEVIPYYEHGPATLYHGDSLAVIADLPAGSVDAVITDPPYSSGGMFRGDRMASTKNKYAQNGYANYETLDDFTGDNRDQRAYAYWCALWLAQCLRITKPGGVCLLFTDWRQLPTTTDALQSGGWIWRGIVPWHKPNGRPAMGRFTNRCEYAVWGTAGPRSPDASDMLPGFFQFNSPRERDHITQKPLALMRELVRIAPEGGTVLDPFAGSGTTGVAALVERRQFVGVEIDACHVTTAADRLRTAAMFPSSRDEQPTLPIAACL